MENSTDTKPPASPPLPVPDGSAALWKRLAMQIAEEAQVVLDNAEWEVSYGSGDLRRTIKAVKRLQSQNKQAEPRARNLRKQSSG